ncbi:MAG TPA: heme-binding domain-containing protein [Pyrinomonadaceae bacterium]|nr:heme-binding domain-containing protein [Pyrinomonadaceae bacterium]
MRKILKWIAIILVIIFVGIQVIRPAKTNPPIDQAQTIEAHTQMTPQVAAILDRSCHDCHSNKTRWPWYSNVAPASWLVIDDVNEARKAMNLSEWSRRDPDRQSKKLQQICDEVTDGAMPLGSYRPLHPGSKLSAADIKTLCDWTSAERARLSRH